MNRLINNSVSIFSRIWIATFFLPILPLLAQEGALTGDQPTANETAATAQTVPLTQTAEPVEITGLMVGFGGVWKAGFATPVTIFLDNATPNAEYTLEIQTVDPDKTPTVVRSKVRYLGPEVGISEVFWPGKSTGEVQIALFDGSGATLLAKRSFRPAQTRQNRDSGLSAVSSVPGMTLFPPPVNTERPLWLYVGNESNGLFEAAALWRPEERERPQISRVGRFVDLPTDRRGYDAVDILFFSGDMTDFFENISADDLRFDALEQWLDSGGRLIMTGGKSALPLIRPGGVLARFVPGTLDEKAREIRIANALVQFVPKAKNLVMTGTLDHPYLELPVLRPASGTTVDLSEGETPLMVRQVRSFGTVTWFAGDLSARPLSNWNGRDGLWLGILGATSERRQAPVGDSSLVQLGYNDLSGQLRSLLDRFDGVENFPFSLILMLIGVYVLAIGPLDWLITHRLLKRPNLTWVTLPLWLILFSALALAIESRIRPSSARVNQIGLIDWDEATAQVRQTYWAGLFSPADDRFDLALIPATDTISAPNQPGEIDFSWLGLSGAGLGATDQKTLSPGYWETPYELGRLDGRLDSVPVRVRSSKSFFGTQLAATAPGEISDFSLKSDYLTGTITNRLGVTLENAILYHRNWAYNVGTLEPGASFTVDRKTPRVDSARVYGGADDPFNRRSGNTMTQSGLDRYDTRSTDSETILRMMMFHSKAGGNLQVGLSNARHHLLDSGELLRAGRVVLAAKAAKGDGSSDGGSDRGWTAGGVKIASERSGGEPLDTAAGEVFIRLFCPVK